MKKHHEYDFIDQVIVIAIDHDSNSVGVFLGDHYKQINEVRETPVTFRNRRFYGFPVDGGNSDAPQIDHNGVAILFDSEHDFIYASARSILEIVEAYIDARIEEEEVLGGVDWDLLLAAVMGLMRLPLEMEYVSASDPEVLFCKADLQWLQKKFKWTKEEMLTHESDLIRRSAAAH